MYENLDVANPLPTGHDSLVLPFYITLQVNER